MNNYAALDAYSAGVSYPIEKNVALSGYCSFRIGGPADRAAWPDSVDSFCELVCLLRGAGIRFTVVGNGSNMLFDDAGYRGTVVFTSRMRQISLADTVLTAECGTPLISMTRAACRAGLSGLEFAHGIPGSCGGAVVMNAGAYGGEICDVLTRAQVLDVSDGGVLTMQRDELDFGYRHSIFSERDLILLSADFALKPCNPEEIRSAMEELMQRRIDRQPLDMPSAGSVFKRCEGRYIGRMIEEAGLKGKRIGGAAVSVKHAGFIVNEGGASSADVLKLIQCIKEEIRSRYGVELECEVRYQKV